MVVADRRSDFIGRAPELARLRSAYTAAAAGEVRTVIIGGEAGIGKSRLVQEMTAGARSSGGVVLAGACFELGAGGLPYQPFVTALRTLTRSVESGRLPALLGPARSEIARLLPELGPVVGTPTAPDDVGAQARLFELVLGVIERLARDAPVVVVVEDVQWADASTRDLLIFLVRSLRDVRVLVLVTVRSEDLAARPETLALLAALERDDRVERMELAPLGREDGAALVRSIVVHPASPSELDTILERADGNPFFIEQLVSVGAREEAIDPDRLPPRLRDIVGARIGSLSDDGQTVLRAASAAGRRLDDELLGCVLDLPELQVHAGLAELVEQGILIAVDDDDDPETPPGHAFRHALLREVAYEGLFAGERARNHGAYARCLVDDHSRHVPAGELAFHFDAARDVDRALDAHVQAAREAEVVHAYRDALEHDERALELWARASDPATITGGDRTRIVQHAAEAAVKSGEARRAVELGRAAVAAIDATVDPERAGEANERLRWFLWEAGDVLAAEASARTALELLPADPPSAARGRAMAQLAAILLFTFRWDAARTEAEAALLIARATGRRPVEALSLGVLGLARAFTGEVDEGIADMRAALDIAIDLDSTDGIALGYANLAVLLDRVGRSEDAIAAALEGHRQARDRGLQRTAGGVMLGHAAKALIDIGRWDEADRRTAEGLASGPLGRANVWLLTTRARLLTRRGDLEAAADLLAVARSTDDELGGTEFRSVLRAVEAELDLARGRPADVRPLTDEGLALAGSVGLPEPGLAWLAILALRAEGDIAERARAIHDEAAAEEAAERSVAILGAIDEVGRRVPAITSTAGPRSAGVTALCLGEVTRIAGQPDGAPWAEAAAAWESLQRPYPAAYARFREAEALLAARGSREEVGIALRSAHGLAATLGAAPLLAEIERLGRQARIGLDRDAGPTPEDGADRGDDTAAALGLTAREVEVLRLVAGGWTNRQIADALFISPKTASVHVSNILGKLGVDTRVEAAATAHRLGLAGDAPLPPDAVELLSRRSSDPIDASTTEAGARTGRVHRTFVVTDIVGSTALVEAIGDAAWSDLRRWHDGALRAAFLRHGGREVDHAGDGFFVAFEDAGAALDCAIDIQRALAVHRRTAGFAPSVRIGVHVGDAQREGAGYSGAALHVASRIAGTAGAGEIVASVATIDEAARAVPDDREAIDLRGVANPITVARIAW